MPRYFFHICSRDDHPDHEGTVLPDNNTARAQAIEMAGAIIQDEGKMFDEDSDWRMNVVDAVGESVCKLKFSIR